MPFCPNSSLFQKNNARNINYMSVLIFLKCLDFEQNVYSRTSSQQNKTFFLILIICQESLPCQEISNAKIATEVLIQKTGSYKWNIDISVKVVCG